MHLNSDSDCLNCVFVFLCVVLRHGQAFSPIYRFSLSDGTIVSAHTKSKLVRSPATNEPQLYMSLHILQRYTVCLCVHTCNTLCVCLFTRVILWNVLTYLNIFLPTTREPTVCGMAPDLGKPMTPLTTMTSPNPMSGNTQGQEGIISSNTPAFSSPGAHKDYRFGCPGATQSTGYSMKMSSPSHRPSPGATSSPRLPPAQYTPTNPLHSPAGMCPGNSSSQVFTSSSLNALQALSECQSISLSQSLGSPDSKKIESPASAGVGSQALPKMETFGEHEQSGNGHDGHENDNSGQRDEKVNLGQFNSSDENKIHEGKGHTKLLQLLTTKNENMESSTSPSPAPEKELLTSHPPGTSGTSATSLKEKHKILHRLLQNSTSPVDLAKITAEATGKEPGHDGTNVADIIKQEAVSPKKKDNALLRYLLDNDENTMKDKVIKTETGEIKVEGGNMVTVKKEKLDGGYEQAEQVCFSTWSK